MSSKRLREDSEESSAFNSSTDHSDTDAKVGEVIKKLEKDSVSHKVKRTKTCKRNSSESDSQGDNSDSVAPQGNASVKEKDVEKILYSSDENEEKPVAATVIGEKQSSEKIPEKLPSDSSSEDDDLPAKKSKCTLPSKKYSKVERSSPVEKKVQQDSSSEADADSEDAPLARVASKSEDTKILGLKESRVKGEPESHKSFAKKPKYEENDTHSSDSDNSEREKTSRVSKNKADGSLKKSGNSRLEGSQKLEKKKHPNLTSESEDKSDKGDSDGDEDDSFDKRKKKPVKSKNKIDEEVQHLPTNLNKSTQGSREKLNVKEKPSSGSECESNSDEDGSSDDNSFKERKKKPGGSNKTKGKASAVSSKKSGRDRSKKQKKGSSSEGEDQSDEDFSTKSVNKKSKEPKRKSDGKSKKAPINSNKSGQVKSLKLEKKKHSSSLSESEEMSKEDESNEDEDHSFEGKKKKPRKIGNSIRTPVSSKTKRPQDGSLKKPDRKGKSGSSSESEEESQEHDSSFVSEKLKKPSVISSRSDSDTRKKLSKKHKSSSEEEEDNSNKGDSDDEALSKKGKTIYEESKNKIVEKTRKAPEKSRKGDQKRSEQFGKKKNLSSSSEDEGKSDEHDSDAEFSSEGRKKKPGESKDKTKTPSSKGDQNISKKLEGKKRSKSSSSESEDDSDNSDGESSFKERKNTSKASKAAPSAGEKKLARMKKFMLLAGVRTKNYNSFWSGCKSTTAKVNKMLQYLEEKGLKGRPTIEKCKKLKKKIETEREISELDLGNIIGDGTRSRRGAAEQKQERTVNKREPEDTPQDFKKRFFRIKDIVSSESD